MSKTRYPMAWLASGFALVLPTLVFGAQEKPQVPPVPEPVRLTPPKAGDDPHEEMARLFVEIEHKMARVNRLLEDASAGGRRSAQASSEIQGTIETIDKLLKDSEADSRATVDDIDRIIELAKHPHPGGT